MRGLVARVASALFILLWTVGAAAGAIMVVGGLGLAQCGFGSPLAGCAGGPEGPLAALLGIGAIAFGALLGYGFGVSAWDELRRWRP